MLNDIGFDALSETDVDSIFEAWDALSPDDRAQSESDFRAIDSMACENGVKVMLEEAEFHGEDLVPVFGEMEGFYDKAFWTFLELPEVIGVSLRFLSSDCLSSR